jgi:hypothetical protein
MTRLRFHISIVLLLALLVSGGCTKYPAFKRYTAQLGLSQDEAKVRFGEPSEGFEWLMAMNLAAFDGDWKKLEKLASIERKAELGTYYYNLANAMQGCLPDKLMDHYQPFSRGLFIPADETSSAFSIDCSGEVWYRLGEMTMAEHSTLLAMIFSPNHSGRNYLTRLAQINLVKGDEAAADKYLKMVGRKADDFKKDVETLRPLLSTVDTVHHTRDVRTSLKCLVASNPENKAARDYLLCYDLLTKDLKHFVEDYDPAQGRSELYDQAMLIVIASSGAKTDASTVAQYDIPVATVEKFNDFTSRFMEAGGKGSGLTDDYGKTYWYFFKYATVNENK